MNRFYLLLITLVIISGCGNGDNSPFSKAAQRSLTKFELVSGFKIELIASEPLIRDPVDMTIDAYGRMYVVEMIGVPSKESGVGRILRLYDTNGDSRMDSSIVFADSLILPSGIMPWKEGIIATDPPNVYYLEDTDGDGKADIRKTILTGFDTSNLEANVNNPVYGLDNWIYLADLPVGETKTGIYFPDDSLGTHLMETTLKFQPDTYQLKALSGQTQFGQTFDQWGSHLMVTNSNHIFQEIIANKYLQRNPNLVIPSATKTLSNHTKVFPITKNPEYQMLTDVGEFTAACSLTAYLGGSFPEGYNKNVTFVCVPVYNLIHADRLIPDGVAYNAKRLKENRAFLASTDAYFRPVNLYIGPDGALYLVDFYRQVIEGPEFISQAVLDTVNLYNGTHKGRIYRISAKGAEEPEWTAGLNLGNMNSVQLVRQLSSENIWWRRTAQRLLVQRDADNAASALIKMANNKESAMGRLHALWTLQGIGKLTSDLIIDALHDPVPGIKANAIKLAELHLNSGPELISALLKLKNDSSLKVRFQLLLTLGYLDKPKVNQVRRNILFRDIDNNWFQIAALSASSTHALTLLDVILKKYDQNKRSSYNSLVNKLSAIIGKSKDAGVINQFIEKAAKLKENKAWNVAILEGLARGLGSRNSIPERIYKKIPLLVQTGLYDSTKAIRKGALHILQQTGLPENMVTEVMSNAKEIITNKKLPWSQRANAIAFLAFGNPDKYQSLLKSFIKPQQPLPIQLSALRTILQISGSRVSQYLIKNWEMLAPDVRSEAINLFIANDKRVGLLLDAIKSGKINKGEISWSQSVRLRSLANMALRKRARKLFRQETQNKKEVIEKYQKALQLEGSASKGKMIFFKNCARCHQFQGVGRHFGPDLGTVQSWSASDIMTSILAPNRSIAHGYEMWNVKLNNSNEIQGLITNETPTSITVSTIDGKTYHISRQDIKSLKTTGMSAMPVGLGKRINPQEMADLLDFLKQK